MRKIGIFVVSLVVFAFLYAGSALAVDVKFSGSFDAAGLYEKRPNLHKTDASTAFFYQQFRLKTVFGVSPGLSLTTELAALEKIWGDTHWTGTRGNSYGRESNGGWARVAENIEVQAAYVTYDAGAPGTFIVGYVPHDTQWGTIWGTSYRPHGIIQWRKPVGNFGFGLKYMKNREGSNNYKSYNTGNFVTGNDVDSNVYVGNVTYKNDVVFTGFKWAYLDGKDMKPATNIYGQAGEWKTTGHLLTPFVILNLGPVKIEAELEHFTGKRKFQNRPGSNDDVSMRTWAFYLDGEFTHGPISAGATYAYASGNDPASGVMGRLPDTSYTSWGGLDYNPGLILWNEDRNNWRGPLGGAHLGTTKNIGNQVTSGVSNAHMISLYAKFRPTEDWDLKFVYLFARAAELPVDAHGDRFRSKNYGHEVDIIATYKITNNLKYMVGAGYLFAGDYFKGADRTFKVKDDYLFTNKLTLTF